MKKTREKLFIVTYSATGSIVIKAEDASDAVDKAYALIENGDLSKFIKDITQNVGESIELTGATENTAY